MSSHLSNSDADALKPLSDSSIALTITHDTHLDVSNSPFPFDIDSNPSHTRLHVRDNTASQALHEPFPRNQASLGLERLETQIHAWPTTHLTSQMSGLRVTEPFDFALLH